MNDVAETLRAGAYALGWLSEQGFIGTSQAEAVAAGMLGEEANFFAEKMIELRARIEQMPATYQTEGKGENAVVWLHYFAGGRANWWIIEKDCEAEQLQAFGLANLFGGPTGQDAELGYISLTEILDNDGELDFHFTPRTLRELKEGKEGRPGPAIAQSCSWCHEINDISAGNALCKGCGHRADVSRSECDCDFCKGEREVRAAFMEGRRP